MKTDFLNNSSVADFQRRLHKLFKPYKLHFRNLKKELPKKSSNNNGSATVWLLSPPFWREKLKSFNARAKSIFSYLHLIPPNSVLSRRWLTVWSTPLFLTSLKLGESHESSTEVALDVVLKMLVTNWAKLVCSSSHVGMFWTEKVALSCGVKRRFSNTPKSVQPLGFSSSSACFALLLSTARSFSLLLRLTKASLNYWVSVERSVVSPLSSVHTVLRSSDFYIQSWSEAESELNRPVN